MGKNSKREEAQHAFERRLQKQREEMERQKQQNRLIRNTMLVLLAVVVLAASVGAIMTAVKRQKAKEESSYDLVSMTVSYTSADGELCEGEILIKLYEDIAPITVKNFRKLVSEGFYDGLTFHRVYSGFMIQGGDPKGDGSGGTTTIKGEFSANGVPNPLSHKRGVISMARSQSMDSASSQFFIMHKDSTKLDGQYAAFGEVISGMDVVDAIAETPVQYASGSIDSVPTSPVNPVTIVKAEMMKFEEESPYDLVSMTVSYTSADGELCEGEILIKLYEDIAPITVKNFRKLVSEGFYNGLTFHRVYSGFMIQGGDPKGDGSGGTTTIKGEFSANGVTNLLSHKRGVISMARSQSMDSASSQFFIMHKDSTHLDGQYAAFGEVISGMDVVDAIAETPVQYASGSIDSVPTSPVNPVTIVKAEMMKSEA